MTTLHRKTTKAARWSAVDVLARQGIQFLVTVVLARLLAPEEFGLVALLGLFTGLAGVFIDSGFGAALIQKRDTSRIDESTVFFFNMAMAAAMAFALCLAAPWIAAFFDKPVLSGLAYAMACGLFLNALGTIHTTLLNKEMNFRTQAKIGIISGGTAGLLGIYLAAHGYGVWSLAASSVLSSLLSTALLWAWHPWRPAGVFSKTSLRTLGKFGGYEMGATLADLLSTSLSLILIGKMHSAADVGLYDRAQRTQQLPVNLLMGIIHRVAYSAFASVGENKQSLARGLDQAQTLCMLISTPLLVIIIALPEPLVLTLFGAQWLSCAPVLQVLAISSLLWPMHVLNLNVLRAQGHADLFFRITVLKKFFAIALTVAASLHGIMALAWAQVAISLLAYGVNTHYTGKLLGYGGLAQLMRLRGIIAAALPMALTVWFLEGRLDAPPALQLVVAGIGGGLVYLLGCSLWCREQIGHLQALVWNGRFPHLNKLKP